MPEQLTIVTDKVRAHIGRQTAPRTGYAEVSRSEIRRFIVAIPDVDPLYHDDAYARKSRFGGIVAPPTLVTTLINLRAPGAPDPLINVADDWGDDDPSQGAGSLAVPFPPNTRLFHGGGELEFRRLAAIGDRITEVSKIVDIYERPGRAGPLAFEVVEQTFTNQRGEVLTVARGTRVIRFAAAPGGNRAPAAGAATQPAPVATPPGSSELGPTLGVPSKQPVQRTLGQVAVGDVLDTRTIHLNVPFMVRWLATYESFTRRDHFDLDYVRAHTEFKNILASGTWCRTYLVHLMKDWVGPGGWVFKVSYQTRASAFAGETLVAWARVVGTRASKGIGYVDLEGGLRRREDGVEIVPMKATVALPLSADTPVPHPFPG